MESISSSSSVEKNRQNQRYDSFESSRSGDSEELTKKVSEKKVIISSSSSSSDGTSLQNKQIQTTHTFSLSDLPDFKALQKAIKKLSDAYKSLMNMESPPNSALEKIAQNLYEASLTYRNELYTKVFRIIDNQKPHHAFAILKKALKNDVLTFNLADFVLKFLTSDKIQDKDTLKKILSQITLVVWEHYVFKSQIQGRHIDLQSRDTIASSLESARHVVLKEKVETRFFIRCVEAVTKILEPGKGKMAEVWRANRLNWLKAFLKTAASASPSGVSLAYLVDPVVDTSLDVYNEQEDGWFKEIQKTCFPKKDVEDAKIALEGKILEGLPKKQDQLLDICKTTRPVRMRTFYITELLIEEIRDKKISSGRRATILDNLFQLAKVSNRIGTKEVRCIGKNWSVTLKKDTFWKVRFVVAKCFKKLVENKDASTERILKSLCEKTLWQEEKHPLVLEKYLEILNLDGIVDDYKTTIQSIPATIKDITDKLNKIVGKDEGYKKVSSDSETKGRLQKVATSLQGLITRKHHSADTQEIQGIPISSLSEEDLIKLAEVFIGVKDKKINPQAEPSIQLDTGEITLKNFGSMTMIEVAMSLVLKELERRINDMDSKENVSTGDQEEAKI